MSDGGPSREDLEKQLQEACAELERRLRAGAAVGAADLLAAYPALAANREAALTLAYTEYVLREQLGQRPDPDAWCAGFPDLRDSLLQLLQVHGAVRTGPGTHADPTATPSAGTAGPLPGIGRRVGGYELLEVIGRGGMGVVYKARQSGLNRVVALKMIQGGPYAAPDATARFGREAEVVARLQHPNIVQVFEVGDHDGCPFLAMEYVAGGSLDQRLAGSPLPARAAAVLIEALARAGEFAHRRGVVHRDLKPANILFQPHPATETVGPAPPDATEVGIAAPSPAADLTRVTPKIVDFGLAKVPAGAAAPTLSGTVLGTPSYMAPEQARGDVKRVGPAADVYALGAILYECLTGRPPFRGETALDTLRLVLTQEPVPPAALNPRVPRDLETVCLKCLEKDSARRYATAGALADDLSHFLNNEPVLARPPSAAYQLRKFAQRNKALLAGTAAVFLALVAGLIGTGVGLVRAQAARDRAVNAEQDARDLLAESYAQAARLAVQRGAWRDALTNLDMALANDHPSRAWLSLQKVRAWCAVHDVAQATRELDALAARPELGELEGPVRLWQAELALGRGDDDRALSLARMALDRRLSPPEQEYALGLLAATSDDAIGHFREALKSDPFHQRASGMLALTLITLGRMAEAREHVTFARKVFPEDPTFAVLLALILGWEDNLPTARAELDASLGQLGPPQVQAARRFVDHARQFRQLAEMLVGEPNNSLPLIWARLLPLIASTSADVRALKSGTGGGLLLPVPPALTRVLREAAATMPGVLLGDRGRAIAALERAFQVHPDAFLAYMQGSLAAMDRRMADADRAFLAAANGTSLIPVERGALYCAVFCEWELADQDPPARRERLARAVQTAHRLIARGRLNPDHAALVASVAIEAGELDLARWVIRDWERQAPEDAMSWQKRLLVEYKAGAHGPAIAAADKILKRLPDDADAKRIRAAAVERLVEQAKKLPP
jgi:serine/threonine protein kinase/Flp pilus assembly protein TadD